MPRYKDLRGQRFGKWTVLDEEPIMEKRGNKTYATWKCRCECGREKVVLGQSLTGGSSKSCGHCTSHYKDLRGKRFGKLLVLDEDPVIVQKQNGVKCAKWKCRCDCGNTTFIFGTSLLCGDAKSCGCERKLKIVPGSKYGKLTIMDRPVEMVDGCQMIWCKCDCGNEKQLLAHEVINGIIFSCGCTHSEAGKKAMSNIHSRFKYKHANMEAITHKDLSPRNRSGVRGVYWNSKAKKWQAEINVQRKRIRLGFFDELEDAAKARKQAEEKYFKPLIEEWESRN